MDKFYGKLEELQQIIENAGYKGLWSDIEYGHCFKGDGKQILNWYSKKGSILFQGQNTGSFKENITKAIETAADPTVTSITSNKKSQKIFVVHGHDHSARDQLELVLRRLGLEPFILMNNSGGGKTIVEALERHIYEEAAFGIVLITPDDYGYSKNETEVDKKPRARQNVILEMGMIMASLGREKMVIIKKGAVDMPSDTQGIIYLEYNDNIKDVVPKLVQRMREVGIQVDANKITEAAA